MVDDGTIVAEHGGTASFMAQIPTSILSAAFSVTVASLWSPVVHADGSAQPPGGTPPADEFQIRYYLTDEDGERDRLMTSNDMQYLFNLARCECGQTIETDIALTGTGYAATTQLRTQIGANCDIASNGNTAYRLCAELGTAFAPDFRRTITYEFSSHWLGSGIIGLDQAIDTAIPFAMCSPSAGNAGIFICDPNSNATANCQGEDYFIKADQSANVPPGSSMMTGPQNLTYDFQPPVAPALAFEISAGDGAVSISWDTQSLGDIHGFRVLCADEDDEPLEDKGIKAPSATSLPDGTIYYTKENLCPDGAFGTSAVGRRSKHTTPLHATTGTSSTSETGTTGTTDTSSTSETETSDASASDDGSDSTADDGGDFTGTGGSTTGGDSGDGSPDRPGWGIESLRWDYVCSAHFAQNTTKARVDGLQNSRNYRFLVVAYDRFGNPIEASDVLEATPVETNDFWEQCLDVSGNNVCGEAGFCNCRVDEHPGVSVLAPRGGALALAGMILWLGHRRRAKRRAA